MRSCSCGTTVAVLYIYIHKLRLCSHLRIFLVVRFTDDHGFCSRAHARWHFLTRERIVPSALLAHFPYVQGEDCSCSGAQILFTFENLSRRTVHRRSRALFMRSCSLAFLTCERIVPSALLAHFPYVQGEVKFACCRYLVQHRRCSTLCPSSGGTCPMFLPRFVLFGYFR